MAVGRRWIAPESYLGRAEALNRQIMGKLSSLIEKVDRAVQFCFKHLYVLAYLSLSAWCYLLLYAKFTLSMPAAKAFKLFNSVMFQALWWLMYAALGWESIKLTIKMLDSNLLALPEPTEAYRCALLTVNFLQMTKYNFWFGPAYMIYRNYTSAKKLYYQYYPQPA
jgi:hypothetical protein